MDITPNPLEGAFTSPEAFEEYLKHSEPLENFRSHSIDEQWREWRSRGADISRQRYRDIARSRLGIEFHQRDIMRLDSDEYVPERYYYSRHQWQLSTDYQYHFKVTFINELTNEQTIETRFLSTDEPLTKTELEETMFDRLQTTSPKTGHELFNVELSGALIMPGVQLPT